MSLWVHDEGVSLGWLGFGRHGRVFARWAELDRPWISALRIGWGAGPIDSYVFRPSPSDRPTVLSGWKSMRPDSEFWDASDRVQMYEPRLFDPPERGRIRPRLGRPARRGPDQEPVRLVRVLHRFSSFAAPLWFVGVVAYMMTVRPGLTEIVTMMPAFWAWAGAMGLTQVVVEAVLRRLTLPSRVVARPFPVNMAFYSVWALGGIVGFLWAWPAAAAAMTP